MCYQITIKNNVMKNTIKGLFALAFLAVLLSSCGKHQSWEQEFSQRVSESYRTQSSIDSFYYGVNLKIATQPIN